MKSLFILVGSAVLFCASVRAQDTATIVGTVTDSSGGVIPGAKVTISNGQKGFTRELITNTVGAYTAAKIPVGDYAVSSTAAGFQTLICSGITVAVGQTLRVDLQLVVGQMAQQMTVRGNRPRVETEAATISDVVTGVQLANLELNGRNFVQLALLVPGAAPGNSLNTTSVGFNAANDISFNGGRYQYNNWEVDGGNIANEIGNIIFNTYPVWTLSANSASLLQITGRRWGNAPVPLLRWQPSLGRRSFMAGYSNTFAMTISTPTTGL